ncbi:hypothetical protein WOLCODRAFT_42641, partial [Wolfiporia cocos MD-104 SS10]
LFLLNHILLKYGRWLTDFPPMPLTQAQLEPPHFLGHILQEELAYDDAELAVGVEAGRERFNPEQANAYNVVLQCVLQQEGKIFFFHSAGGGGKTFTCNAIASAVQTHRKVALCVESSGIASLLLIGWCTAHSQFKIPIVVHETSTCHIPKNSNLADLIWETGIII